MREDTLGCSDTKGALRLLAVLTRRNRAFGNPGAMQHYDRVLRELCPPSKLTAQKGGFAFLYEHLETREWQLGMNLRFPVEYLASGGGLPLPVFARDLLGIGSTHPSPHNR
jgi:hypothetical protein